MFFQCLFDEDVWQRFNTGNDKMSYLSTAFLKMSANCRPAPTEVQAQPGGGERTRNCPGKRSRANQPPHTGVLSVIGCQIEAGSHFFLGPRT